MTASAINIASMAPNAQPGAGAAASAAGGGNALAGFEALLGALFPQADPGAAGAQNAPPAGAPTGPDPLAAADSDHEARPAPDAAPTTSDGQPTVGDAAVALAASLLAAQPASVETQVTTPKDNTATPPAWSRDKAKGAPAAPAVVNANPKAGLAEKAELAPEAAEEDEATVVETASLPTLPGPAPTGAPKANAPAPKPAATAPTPQAPATPAIETPDAPPAPVLADAPVEPTPPETNPPAITAATLTPRAEAAPAPAAPAKPTKAERARSAADASEPASDVGKPLEVANKPAGVKPGQQGPAKSSDATVEAADAKPEDTKTALESPDAPAQGETRAASHAAAPPAAQATHTVRGSPETVANLAAQIVKKLEGKTTRFDVELDPHGLGKVDVRIEIGAQGRITAGMVFDNPQAAADVKARASELQRALEQAGFDITGGMSFDVAQDRGQQQQQNQAWQDQGETGRAFRGQAFRAALETADAADAANQGALRLRRGVNAGLDVRI